MRTKSKIISGLMIIILSVMFIFLFSNYVESKNNENKVESITYSDFEWDDNDHKGIKITLGNYTKEIKSMPELAYWIKNEKNKFFSLDLTKLIKKQLNQRRDKSGTEAFDEINGRGHIGAVAANNGMCLCENQGNSVESYTIYNAIDITYKANEGYDVKVYEDGKTKTVDLDTIKKKTYVSKLVNSFHNIEEWGGTGYMTAPAQLRKNEAKFYIYSLRNVLGLNTSPITLSKDDLEWLSSYGTGGNVSAKFMIGEYDTNTNKYKEEKEYWGTGKINKDGTGEIKRTSDNKTVAQTKIKRFDATEDYANRINNHKIKKEDEKIEPEIIKNQKAQKYL